MVDGVQCNCRLAMDCPFQGWTYNLDSTLRGAAAPTIPSDFTDANFGLKPIEQKQFNGFLFLRFHPGPQPEIAPLLAPFVANFVAYETADILPTGAPDWGTTLAVNRTSVREMDTEGYHGAMARSGLQDRYGRTYRDHRLNHGLFFCVGHFGDVPGRKWSVRNDVGQTIDPDLPRHLQKA